MERLNLRTPKPYDYSAEAGTLEQRIRFYCVSEGATEESYFTGVRNNREALDIKNNVLVEVVPKEDGQETYSHPLQLVNACLQWMGRIDTEGKDIPKEDWEKHCGWEDFNPEIDVVCVIFDRDYKNLETCLDEIFSLCEKHGIRIVISNPNFELWLLMHFPDIGQYNKKMLLENRKNLRHQLFSDASAKKKYLEILVSKHSEGYSKGGKLKFERFQSKVDLAVEQASLFSEEPEELRTELGTTVGKLIQAMRSKIC